MCTNRLDTHWKRISHACWPWVVLFFVWINYMHIRHLNYLKKLSLKTLIFSVLFLISIGAFLLVTYEVIAEREEDFDRTVFSLINDFRSPLLIRFFKWLSFFGSSDFLLPAHVLLGLLLLYKKRLADLVLVIFLGLASFGIVRIAKGIFERSRPDNPLFQSLVTYSYPSGHTFSSFIFCSIVGYLVWKTNWHKVLKWLSIAILFMLTISIGASRIILRYHYASDVLAGFSLGLSWVLFTFWIKEKLHKSRNIPTILK